MSSEVMIPELVVFDIAGTTVVDNGEVARCFREALSEEALEFPESSINAIMGLPKILAIRQLLAEFAPERSEPGLDQSIHDDFEQRMMEYYLDDPRVSVYPGVLSLFRQLREHGVAVAVNTGFPRSILDSVLERLGWRVGRTLDAAIASNESPKRRYDSDSDEAVGPGRCFPSGQGGRYPFGYWRGQGGWMWLGDWDHTWHTYQRRAEKVRADPSGG